MQNLPKGKIEKKSIYVRSQSERCRTINLLSFQISAFFLDKNETIVLCFEKCLDAILSENFLCSGMHFSEKWQSTFQNSFDTKKKIIKFSGSRPSFQERNYRLIYFFFRSDVLFCFILFLLAISVGYMGNHCLTNAPKTSEDSDAQEATSLILTAVFVLGQASGSFFSLFVIRAI